MKLSLRKALDSDFEFLLNLRESTMHQYLEGVGMPTSRESHCERINYKFDCAKIIEVDGKPAGLFKVEYLEDKRQWYVIQFQLHSRFQNLKIGRTLLEQLLATAKSSNASVGLSVIKTNPALRLYQRLGFQQVGSDEFEYELVNQTVA